MLLEKIFIKKIVTLNESSDLFILCDETKYVHSGPLVFSSRCYYIMLIKVFGGFSTNLNTHMGFRVFSVMWRF